MKKLLLALATTLIALAAYAADFDDADKRRVAMGVQPEPDGAIDTEFERRAWMWSYTPGGEPPVVPPSGDADQHKLLLGVG